LDQRTGLPPGLADYVLGLACRAVAGWSAIPGGADLRIAVNVSARQILGPGFVPTVSAALVDAGLEPDRLILEIAESAELDDPVAQEHLRQVAASGVFLALDDFGAVDVSATVLRAFPVAQIKVDQVFTTGSAETLQLVLSVARLLAGETVVQGIDTAEQLAALPSGTCAQGDHVAVPMSAYEMGEWLGLRVS